MAINRARKVTKKPTSAAAANEPNTGGSSSAAMAETPPDGPGDGQNHTQPSPPLPPGVYFDPTREECLGFLNRWIAGDNDMPDAHGYIHRANVYDERPNVLRQRHPPGSTRAGEHAWWFLSQTRFQSQAPGGGANKRADRSVKAGGYWRLEQSKKKLDADGLKNSFGFYTGPSKSKDKSPWLMQEFTSANDNGVGKRGVPALHRVYVTPRATDDELREIFGEDGVQIGPDGNKKPARAMVPQEYFDSIAVLLPHGSVRGVGQEHDAPQQAAAPEGFLDYNGQEGQYLGQYQQQEGQYHGQYIMEGASQADIFGQYQQHDEEPSDNLTMSMDEFMGIVNEDATAETVKGEPNWGSLDAIVDDDEFANFNNDG